MQIAALFSIQINKTQQTKKHTRSQFPEKESAPDLYKKIFLFERQQTFHKTRKLFLYVHA